MIAYTGVLFAEHLLARSGLEFSGMLAVDVGVSQRPQYMRFIWVVLPNTWHHAPIGSEVLLMLSGTRFEILRLLLLLYLFVVL